MKGDSFHLALATAVTWTLGCGGLSSDPVESRPGSDPQTTATQPATGEEPAAEEETTGSGGEANAPAPPEASDASQPTFAPVVNDAGLPAPEPPPAPDVSCELTATPCEGDVAGSWSVLNCPLELTGQVSVAGLGLGCLGGQIRSGFLQVSGTWAIDANGNFQDDSVTRGEQEFELAAECFAVAALITCERTATVLATVLGYSTLRCTDDGEGGCVCSGAFAQTGSLGIISDNPVAVGSYFIEGATLTTTEAEGHASYEHCASSDRMVLTIPERTNVGSVEGSIVLVRQ